AGGGIARQELPGWGAAATARPPWAQSRARRAPARCLQNGVLSTMGDLETNLAAVGARAPGRASAIASATPLDAAIEAAGSGEPTLAADGVLLHSREYPAREAKLWAGRHRAQLEIEQVETAVVLGFGLGYHLEALAAVWRGRLVVVEPDDRLLRTALAVRDLRTVLARVELAP